jgi:RNA polymerase sigma factor (sigma-70 family)
MKEIGGINRPAGNEPDDVGKLIIKHRPALKSFIKRRVSNEEDAEDILQDVFYQFIKAVDNALNPIEQVSAWLYRVARNTIINKGKKKHEEQSAFPAEDENDNLLSDFSDILFHENSDGSTPETEYMRTLFWQELETALSELPPEQREAFELTELEGLPVKDIAKTTGIAVNTLLSRKHYAVKHLRKRLEGLYKDIICY